MLKKVIGWFKETFKDFDPNINFKHMMGSALSVFLLAMLNGFDWYMSLLFATLAALTGSGNDFYGFLRNKGAVPTVKGLFLKIIEAGMRLLKIQGPEKPEQPESPTEEKKDDN